MLEAEEDPAIPFSARDLAGDGGQGFVRAAHVLEIVNPNGDAVLDTLPFPDQLGPRHGSQHRPRLAFGCRLGTFPGGWNFDWRARLLFRAGALAAFGGSLFGGFHLDDYAIFYFH